MTVHLAGGDLLVELDESMRARLTGPAQVTKGIAGTRYEDFDLEYVEKSTTLGGWRLVRYDLGILAETLRVLARGEGLNF